MQEMNHKWDDSYRSCHPQGSCTGKKYDEDKVPKCVGKDYKTKNVFLCDFHLFC